MNFNGCRQFGQRALSILRRMGLLIRCDLLRRIEHAVLAQSIGIDSRGFLSQTAVNSFVNFVSRSCMTLAGFCSRPAVSSRNRSVWSTTHAELGCSVEVEQITSASPSRLPL